MSKKQAPKPSKPRGAGKSPQTGDKRRARRERRPGELSTPQKVVIVIFIAIFALSTLAGALASVIQSSQTVEYNVDYVDSQYESVVADLESKVQADPSDTDSLLELARDCSSWGSLVTMLAQDDDERAHGTELVQRAIGYYDQYLEQDDTPEARTERAMCSYQLGDTESARADLEAVTESSPDYAPAWADLGMILEGEGATDDAVAAYQKAVELDPDDEAGAKSYAQERLDQLTGTDDSSDEQGESTDDEQGGDAAADDSAAGEDTATADDTGASE